MRSASPTTLATTIMVIRALVGIMGGPPRQERSLAPA
jgi:hypothetical protein